MPLRRPFCILRHLTFFGASIVFLGAYRGALLLFLLGQNLAAEDPHLDADHAIGGLRLSKAEVHGATEGVQPHAPLAVPLPAGDFRATQTARRLDADA